MAKLTTDLPDPTSTRKQPPNEISPGAKAIQNSQTPNLHSAPYGLWTCAAHLLHQKDEFNTDKNNRAMWKSAITYCKQQLSCALDNEMSAAVDACEQSATQKLQVTLKKLSRLLRCQVYSLHIFRG
jgi:hypothetical protein